MLVIWFGLYYKTYIVFLYLCPKKVIFLKFFLALQDLNLSLNCLLNSWFLLKFFIKIFLLDFLFENSRSIRSQTTQKRIGVYAWKNSGHFFINGVLFFFLSLKKMAYWMKSDYSTCLNRECIHCVHSAFTYFESYAKCGFTQAWILNLCYKKNSRQIDYNKRLRYNA